jgi:hypothetical protein
VTLGKEREREVPLMEGDDFWNMGEEALRLHGLHSWCPGMGNGGMGRGNNAWKANTVKNKS